MKKRIIWTSEPDLEIIEQLQKEEYMPLSAAYEAVQETGLVWFDDAKSNLNIDVENPILVIADLGLWNGRKTGYRILQGNNLSNILITHCGDFVTYYADAYNVCCEDIHHDGTNYYLFRELRGSEDLCQPLLDAIYCQREYKSLMKRYSRSILPYVADVYGWPMAGRKRSIA